MVACFEVSTRLGTGIGAGTFFRDSASAAAAAAAASSSAFLRAAILTKYRVKSTVAVQLPNFKERSLPFSFDGQILIALDFLRLQAIDT